MNGGSGPAPKGPAGSADAALATLYNWRISLIPVLVGVIACAWLLPSLGNGMLWQDEAQTALLARTTLTHGVPVAFDGQNSISQEGGDDYGAHGLWKWHMWLPFYLLAGFFKLFGQTTSIARLPFALFGVATVVLIYFTSKLLWNDWKSAVVSSLLLLMCIPFVLLVRQCRYYAPSIFFSLLMLDSWLRIVGGSRKSAITLTVAGVLLFNTHFLYCASAWGAIVVHMLGWHRQVWKQLIWPATATAILCAPPVLWLASLNYRNYARGTLNPMFTLFQLRIYVTLIFRHILPWPFLPVAVLAVMIRAFRRGLSLFAVERGAPLLLFSVITVAVAAPFTPGPAFRYLGPLIPPLLIILSRMLVSLFRVRVFLGAAATGLVCWWWPISGYVFELTHRYVGPMEGIVQILNQRSRPGDVVLIPYGDLPIKFYTQLRVIGGLTGEDLHPAEHARWLVLRYHRVLDREIPTEDFIRRQLNTYHDYDRIALDAPDTEFENREDPEIHRFATATDEPPVIICCRRAP